MVNQVFEALLEEKINSFVRQYNENSRSLFFDGSTKRLRHAGEFGTFREAIVRDFLRFFIPGRIDISNGFVITSKGGVSTQCDIIAFDAKSTPLIESGERQRFFPVETVCGLGEVKSVMSRVDFIDAINKLAKIKMLREEIQSATIIRRERDGYFDPLNYAYDQIPSFLICEKLDFNIDNLVNEVGGMYSSDIAIRHRHNLILSLKDGIFLYLDDNNKSMMFPEITGRIQQDGSISQKCVLKNRFVKPDKSLFCHVHLFCTYMFLMTSSVTVLYPDMACYLSLNGGLIIDQS
ncbi:DUF6602 domain-containing protein [Rhodanobacter sp. Si-c]|uniref:DUF6602 domain-containing protein n=1 Tax=Rhodanobacter lycopersici TaxID=3162487 RepID=A0ABV3QH44_9GAMM